MVKFCTQCGSRLDDDAMFCTECGTTCQNKEHRKRDKIKNNISSRLNDEERKDKFKRKSKEIEESSKEKLYRKKDKEILQKPEGALYFIDGREATISVFNEYIELDFTNNLVKKWLSGLGGNKRIYYHQMNSIQKRDATKFILGSLEFELPGIVRSARGGMRENVIHYEYVYQQEADAIYEYANDKILQMHNPNYRQNIQESNDNEVPSLSQLKEAKELLDMGIITSEEFDEIKRKLLKQI